MRILTIDLGGSFVKLLVSGAKEPRRAPTGPDLTPQGLVDLVWELTPDWPFDAVSFGYPGVVRQNRPVVEPNNLGQGWVGFDYRAGFGRPVRVINDAAMQALGAYAGGCMLFLGLGTGLGSALVLDRHVQPMELSSLPYKDGFSYGDCLAQRGIDRLGPAAWQREVLAVVPLLKHALCADYVVLGGGNTRHLEILPPHTHVGANANAFIGGFRLWEDEIETE